QGLHFQLERRLVLLQPGVFFRDTADHNGRLGGSSVPVLVIVFHRTILRRNVYHCPLWVRNGSRARTGSPMLRHCSRGTAYCASAPPGTASSGWSASSLCGATANHAIRANGSGARANAIRAKPKLPDRSRVT